MLKMLQSKWVATAVGIVSYLVTTGFMLLPARWMPSMPTAAASVAAQPRLLPSWEFRNPEFEQMLAEIREEKEALRIKAQQLQELEARLAAERQEILAVTQAVYQLRAEMDRAFVRVVEEEAANLKRLAKLYSTMPPDSASRILKELSDDQIVRVMAFMKESEGALLLEALSKEPGAQPKRAAAISERLRTLVRNPNPASPSP